jgi:geranylgeranyl pyrophosphate synthase
MTPELKALRDTIEDALTHHLPVNSQHAQILTDAMRYSVLSGGKRIRPLLVCATCTGLGGDLENALAPACAVEFIHAYSLLHDDLPAMDDDDLRRGRPTCHKAFDEATAILAGDSLQVLAFKLLASHPGAPADPSARVRLIDRLAEASGTSGMAGGQALDLAAEGRPLDVSALERIHTMKTGALLQASVMMAADCAHAPLAAEPRRALEDFGAAIGLAFQVQDDLLDVTGDTAVIGKPAGSDAARGLPTYPFIAGLPATRARIQGLHGEAQRLLAAHGWSDSPLAALSDWLLTRQR